MDVPAESPAALRTGLNSGSDPVADPGPVVRSGPDAGPGRAESSEPASGPDPAALGVGASAARPDRSAAAPGGCGIAGTGTVAAGGGEPGAVDTVDALLPQTQCRRCGYDACRPYAEALVRGGADINRCPPGGEATVAALARALGRRVIPLDPVCGPAGPRETARIVESECIGCTVCIRACPVDAIIGARRWMHAVLESECTGCGLCVEPCPVDCILMVTARTGPATPRAWLAERAPLARRRFERRRARESGLETAPHLRERAARIDTVDSLRTRTLEQRRADIAAAVARVGARKAQDAERVR